MILKVSADGLLIPRDFLPGVEEYDLRREEGRIVVVPVSGAYALPGGEATEKIGSIYELGVDPVDCGIRDGAERHDHYIYDNPHGDRP